MVVDLSEMLSACAKAQDRVVPVILPGQRCNPFARHGEVLGAARSGVRGLRSVISSVGTELIGIMRPIVVNDHIVHRSSSSSANLHAACGNLTARRFRHKRPVVTVVRRTSQCNADNREHPACRRRPVNLVQLHNFDYDELNPNRNVAQTL